MARMSSEAQAGWALVFLVVALAVCVLNDWWVRWLRRRRESSRGFEIRTTAPAPDPPEAAPQAAAAPSVTALPLLPEAPSRVNARVPSGWSLFRSVIAGICTGKVGAIRPDGRVEMKCVACGGLVPTIHMETRPDVDQTFVCPGCGAQITVRRLRLFGRRN